MARYAIAAQRDHGSIAIRSVCCRLAHSAQLLASIRLRAASSAFPEAPTLARAGRRGRRGPYSRRRLLGRQGAAAGHRKHEANDQCTLPGVARVDGRHLRPENRREKLITLLHTAEMTPHRKMIVVVVALSARHDFSYSGDGGAIAAGWLANRVHVPYPIVLVLAGIGLDSSV